MTRTRVIGLGQAFAGDDGVGLAVVEHLRSRVPAHAAELLQLADASQLIEPLCDVDVVWIVDAVDLGDRVGEVVELELGELCARASCSASSHGLDVAQAIQLGQELYPQRIASRIRILAIAIDAGVLKRTLPATGAARLSPAVARAAEAAAQQIFSSLPHAAPRDEVIAHARE